MQGVLGGQVRFNIRLRQVGAQATPPLCSLQLWYTFPSGHSPTSTLSGSADQKSILNRKSTTTTCQSWETCGNCRRKGYWVCGLERDFVVSVEVEGYPFPLAHTPSCRFCRGWRGGWREAIKGDLSVVNTVHWPAQRLIWQALTLLLLSPKYVRQAVCKDVTLCAGWQWVFDFQRRLRLAVTHHGPEALKVTSPGCDTPPMA